MKATPDKITISQLLELKKTHMLVVNPEYQRGVVWTIAQKKRLIDSVLRGYPLPLIYFHYIKQEAAGLQSQRYEVIDGQQRIDALCDYAEGAFRLFDPRADEAAARFPDFVKREPCLWGRKLFEELTPELKAVLLNTPLMIVKIEADNGNEARDLFVRLQAGMPLTSQEKRDAWPGQFTDFILRLAGKPNVARYPGVAFFNELMGAPRIQDRGKFRQLAAQIAMLYFRRRKDDVFCDINAQAIDDFYYENLDFDANTPNALRLGEILEKIALLLRGGRRKKLLGHEAIHLVLLVDTLLDDYTPSWEAEFAAGFDYFREQFAAGKATSTQPVPSEYWLRYGVLTRVNSDRGDSIRRRHEFFASKMRERLALKMKDVQRAFGALERELIYYRDKRHCAVCNSAVGWDDLEIHHIEEHAKGGPTSMENGISVHKSCHPQGQVAVEFANAWRSKRAAMSAEPPSSSLLDALDDEDEDDQP